MKKIFILSILLLTIVLPIIAQKKTSATEILDKTSKRIQTNGILSANFVLTTNENTKNEGTVLGTIYMKGQKYMLKTTSVNTWFNGKDQWTLLAGDNEVNLVTPTQEELQTSSPSAFLNLYKYGYALSVKDTELRSKPSWEITMTAKSKKQEPSKIIVIIDKKTYDILNLRVCSNGNWTRISISDIKTNPTLTEAIFTFPVNEYKNCQIIDMR
jgi:outer membrane lipoprotein-sorting protein